jgi:small subunit ribosomal protein S3
LIVGQKVNPIGFRVGVIKGWDSAWYADKSYADQLHEDLKLKKYIKGYDFNRKDGSPVSKDPSKRENNPGSISRVQIERKANNVIKFIINTGKPGVIIGSGGKKSEELRKELQALTGKQVLLSINEVRNPDLDAQLVAENIAGQLEKRIAFRRAMKQSMARAEKLGCLGIKMRCSGRLGGAEIARTESYSSGRLPLHTLRADVDYGFAEAATTYGRIGVKVWIYKGEVLPKRAPGQNQGGH